MPKDDILKLTIENKADNEHAREDLEKLDKRVENLEIKERVLHLAIAKCTAIWGFILTIGTAIGGFVAYNYDKVSAAVVAAFQAFKSNGN